MPRSAVVSISNALFSVVTFEKLIYAGTPKFVTREFGYGARVRWRGERSATASLNH